MLDVAVSFLAEQFNAYLIRRTGSVSLGQVMPGAIGAKYQSSVLYRARLVTIRDQETLGLNAVNPYWFNFTTAPVAADSLPLFVNRSQPVGPGDAGCPTGCRPPARQRYPARVATEPALAARHPIDCRTDIGLRPVGRRIRRSEEHTSELQSHHDIVCRLLLEKKKKKK